jgi:hypothetical protein
VASPNQPVESQAPPRDGQRVESSYVSPPPQPAEDPLAAWDGWTEPQPSWLARLWVEHFERIQAVAAAVSLLGILLIAVAAILAANPLPQMVLTFLGLAMLILTVLRPARSAS